MLFNKYRNGDISVFGNGWIGLDRRISKLNMSKVALFYSNSKSALGVLWDIQRYKTLNSRYFYAPLNGCLLFCEENSNLLDVPGVFGYSEMLNKLDNFGIEQSKDLQSKAIAFWNNENKNLISQLSLREKSLFFIGLYNNILSFFINSYFKFK